MNRRDEAGAKLLALATGGNHGALQAAMRYACHAYVFDKIGDADAAEIFGGFATESALTYVRLNSLLAYYGFACTPPAEAKFSGGAAKQMLLEDIAAERCLKTHLQKILPRLKDARLSAVGASCAQVAEKRIETLETLYEKLFGSRLLALSGLSRREYGTH